MSIRSTLFLASTAVAAMMSPAAAQDVQYDPVLVESHEGTYEGDWEGQWQDDQTWRGMWNGTYTTQDGRELEGRYVGTFIGEGRFITDDGQELLLDEVAGWREGDNRYEVQGARRDPRTLGASPDGRLAYTLAEREAWLADCRLLMAGPTGYHYGEYYDDDDTDSALLGGVLGAVVGGVAGNRIADGDRLAGTLIGAGVGGLAGAVIGSAIDGDGRQRDVRDLDANEIWAARYCDAYLRRYEMGGGAGFYGYGYAQPVMMVQTLGTVPHGRRGHRHGPQCTTTVREEWVEVEAPAPRRARRVIERRAQPAAQPEPQQDGKVTPVD